MTTARATQVNVASTPYYHCISRCVRRAFLMGHDHATGQSFDHRKGWLLEELARLTGVFAVEVCAYAVMSNHYHLVVRVDVERVAGWEDAEVLARAEKLFPRAVRLAKEQPGRLTELLAVYRERLGSLSWFMRCLNEAIARRANREDDCTGRFWEGRFKSQPLLDAGALLTCMSYVDLNPVRAGLAGSLAGCDFTSIRARLADVGHDLLREQPQSTARNAPVPTEEGERGPALVPFAEDERDAGLLGPLPMVFSDYVELVRFTGQALREGSAGTLPLSVVHALHAVGLDDRVWLDTVRGFPSRFCAMLGERHLIALEAERQGRSRPRGTPWARKAYLAA